MPKTLKILIVDDNPNDAELLSRALHRAGFVMESELVDTEGAFLECLDESLDLILSDFQMPSFSGVRALELLKESGLDVPFIIVSGTIGEETAVEVMKLGATDYLLKDRLARLGTAATRAMADCELRRERRRAEKDLADERRRGQVAIEESNRRFNDMLANVDLIAITVDTDGRITFCNDFLLRMTGWAREEVMGRSWFERFVPPHASGLERLFRDNIRVGTIPSHYQYPIKSKGGELREILWNNTVLRDASGSVAGLASIGEDVTERSRAEAALRESEALFRQVVENIHEVFWMSDAVDGSIIYVSPSFEAIWGRSCDSLYKTPNLWAECVDHDDRERVLMAARVKQSEGAYDEEYRIVRPDGSVRWIRDRAFPIRGADGTVFRVVGTAEDITEYRNLEEQYRHAQKLEAIGTLAGGIAHDFNNILTAISCYTELAKMDSGTNSQVTEHLDAVLEGTRRATDLVRQILAFGRRQGHQRRPVNLREVIEEALKLLRATIPASIEFDVSLARNTPTVLADVTQIHQVMMNLGTNAAYAMRDGPGKLSVSLSNFEVDAQFAATKPNLRPGPYVLLRVVDTGHGMDAATMARIFEPFFTTKGPGEGTGLGLSAVHGIMQGHEGALFVFSSPGEGASFHLYFPMYAGDEAAQSPRATQVPRGNGERILFVDDEVPLARLGKNILERLGYIVDTHTRANGALDAVLAAPDAYALVVTDQMMPGMTGATLAQRLHAIRSDMPIILTTGYTATLTSENVRDLGIRRLLLKPLSVESLGESVHFVLASRNPK